MNTGLLREAKDLTDRELKEKEGSTDMGKNTLLL